ncbi:MAG: type II secretion system F family protein [Acidobacteriota bacterium]|nr:type II secretion system F family protein [Acidobacteriota bacterium]
MGVAVLSFCVIFLLIASGGLLIFYRETVQARISAAINPHLKQKSLKSKLKDTRGILGDVVEQFERVIPRSDAEVSVIQKRLILAGFRKDAAVKIFYGTKVIAPLLLLGIAVITGLARQSPFFILIACLGLGFLIPDFWLGKLITRRQASVRRGLPDVLDMLVICVEAGLSLDQATARTSVEMQQSQPVLSDELGVVALEQRAGTPRSDAWKHLADRTGVDNVRNLVSMLVQSEQFGTSIAKTLRVHSDTLRIKRVQEIEEKAAKLSVKLLFPLALFIFPSLFLVVLGPAAISMSDSFKTLFNQ